MNRPRLIRGVRIAVSAVFGMLCVLLLVLWVRSYWALSTFGEYVTPSHRYHLYSFKGQLVLSKYQRSWAGAELILFAPTEGLEEVAAHPPRFGIGTWYGGDFIVVSYWLVTVANLCLAIVPWLPWRFSLRTLLIATALIAGVLGLAVCAAN
jgi:hypothetical protein